MNSGRAHTSLAGILYFTAPLLRVSYRELIPDVIHDTSQYANNRAELYYQSTRLRERMSAAVYINGSGADSIKCSCHGS
jgi:transposase-like protein